MKQSELLRKQADMMDLAEKHGVSTWTMLVKYRDSIYGDTKAHFDFLVKGIKYQFALGVVEGKPVFTGDELYHERIGKVKVRGESGTFFKIVDEYGNEYKGSAYNPETFSWNPPKPRTILVELLVEDKAQ